MVGAEWQDGTCSGEYVCFVVAVLCNHLFRNLDCCETVANRLTYSLEQVSEIMKVEDKMKENHEAISAEITAKHDTLSAEVAGVKTSQEKLVDELAQMKDSQEKLVAMMAQLLEQTMQQPQPQPQPQ
jgi:chromosome segregation ATPase